MKVAPLIVILALLSTAPGFAGRGACVVCESDVVKAGCYDDNPIDQSHMTTNECLEELGGESFWPERFCADELVAAALDACPGVTTQCADGDSDCEPVPAMAPWHLWVLLLFLGTIALMLFAGLRPVNEDTL